MIRSSIVVVTRHDNGAYVVSHVYPSDFTDLTYTPMPSVILGTNATAADIPGLDPDATLPTAGHTRLFAIDGGP